MSDRAETCPPRDTSPIPEDWPDAAVNLPLLPLWPYLTPTTKREIRSTLALLRQPRHAPAKLVKCCTGCGETLGEVVDGELHAGPLVIRSRTTYWCRVCRRRGQWRPAQGAAK